MLYDVIKSVSECYTASTHTYMITHVTLYYIILYAALIHNIVYKIWFQCTISYTLKHMLYIRRLIHR